MKKITDEQAKAIRDFGAQIDALWTSLDDSGATHRTASEIAKSQSLSLTALMAIYASDITSLSNLVYGKEQA